jgi:Protein of unknown function DUF111
MLRQIHFHEVGAVDSIVDTVGVVLGLHLLHVDEVWCSRLPFGEVRVSVWGRGGLLFNSIACSVRNLAPPGSFFLRPPHTHNHTDAHTHRA